MKLQATASTHVFVWPEPKFRLCSVPAQLTAEESFSAYVEHDLVSVIIHLPLPLILITGHMIAFPHPRLVQATAFGMRIERDCCVGVDMHFNIGFIAVFVKGVKATLRGQMGL